MKHSVFAAAALLLLVGAHVTAHNGKYWYENNAVKAEIIDLKTVGTHDLLTVRVTNLGPLTIYLAAQVGTHQPASLEPKGLFGDSLRRIGVPNDVRAACTLALKADESVEGKVGTDHRMFPNGQPPSKIEVAVTVFPTLRDCRKGTRAFTFYTPPRAY